MNLSIKNKLVLSIGAIILVITGLQVWYNTALFPKSTIKPQLPQPQVTVTLGAFLQADQGCSVCLSRSHTPSLPLPDRCMFAD